MRAIDRSEPEGVTPARLYAVVHREAGPLLTFTSREEARRELADVLRDEPTWAEDLWVEPFEVVVADPPER